MKEFLIGFTTPFRALKLIMFKPRLLTLSALPVMISIGVLSAAIYAVISGTGGLITAQLGTYFGFAAQGLIAIALFFLAFQIVIFVINLLSIPFNDLLAEQTEKVIGETPPQRPGFGYYFRVMRMDVAKSVLNLILMVMFTVGTWIPVVGIVFFIGVAVLNTLNFISYPQSRRLLGIGESLTWLKKNWPRSLGFGIATTLLFSFPVVNFFALPLSVVGGTLIYFRDKES